MNYTATCFALGLVLAWIPMFFHGPIHEKFDIYYLNGSIIVWGWYVARLFIGLWVGMSVWPPQWYLRGPMCGVMAMLPLGFVSLGTPGCGAECLFWNGFTGALLGLLIGGIAKRLTGKSHAYDIA